MKSQEKEKIVNDLYKRKYRAVLSQCTRYTNRNLHEAEELAHEIFFNAFNNLDGFRWDSSIDTWLFRITKNACYNYSRALRSNKRHSNATYSVEKIIDDYEKSDSRATGRSSYFYSYFEDKITPDALENIESSERREMILRVIGELPKKYKECFMAFIEKGYFASYSDVAKKLFIKINTVRSRLARGRILLKKKLGKNIN